MTKRKGVPRSRVLYQMKQRAEGLEQRTAQLLNDFQREFPAETEIIDGFKRSYTAAATALRRMQHAHHATKRIIGTVTPGQLRILNHLRDVGDIAREEPMPPMTAASVEALQVQICGLRKRGYDIRCVGTVKAGQHSTKGFYRLYREPNE